MGEPEARHSWVDVDGAAGVRAATEHLIARGHQRIWWLGWSPSNRVDADRRSGWEQAMRAAGLPTDGLVASSMDTVEAATEAAGAFLDAAGDRPDAVVCATDTLGIGVLHALVARGLRAGTDVGVVGFDDSTAAQIVPPGLTSVRAPLEEVATEVITALQRLLGPDDAEPTGVLLTPRLVVRGSTDPSDGPFL
ncbi:substrate-binding domain-containing protein [Nocardioides sambongensis]|uniref:substrate-binding domain-containing protein n=1 Tax=Nocardioides sambongensis TaxID=2589074 RepID=UPI001E44AD2D|nr:substrate-binding domain-containing protein [Nocardioides sambongensis]